MLLIDFKGHGIINSDSEMWRTQRKAGLKFFTGSNLDTLVEEVLPNAYMQTRSILLQHAESSQTLDLEAVLLDLTTAVVGRMAYDVSLFKRFQFRHLLNKIEDGYQRQLPIQPCLRLRLRPNRPPFPKPALFHHRASHRLQIPLIPGRSEEIRSADRLQYSISPK